MTLTGFKKVIKYSFVAVLSLCLLLTGLTRAGAEEIVLYGRQMRITVTGELDVMLYDTAGSPVYYVAYDGSVEDYSEFAGGVSGISGERTEEGCVIIFPIDFDGALGLTANTSNPGHISAEEMYDETNTKLIARRNYRYVAGVSDTIRLADLYASGIASASNEAEEEDTPVLTFLVIGLGVLMVALTVPIVIIIKNKKEEIEE